MAGLLGYLSILADDIGSLAGKTAATTAKSLATSLDDIGILFDDIATYTKLASIKSSGLLVDDLAAIANFTNETTSEILKKELEKAKDVEEFENNVKKLDEETQQKIIKELEHIREVAMLEAKRKAALRELPIVYKIAKGSFINKFIIIPVVLLLSYIAPWAIAPILIIGGAYLAYEGVESILEKFGHHQEDEQTAQKESSNEDFEDQKVKSAIKTDFILSFEIIVIGLSLLDNSDFITKLMVLISVGILTTIFVYGIVAFIIKLDDIVFYLKEKIQFYYAMYFNKFEHKKLSNSEFEEKRINRIIGDYAGKTFGIDMSHYQRKEDVEWDSLSIGNRSIPIKFVVLRGTMGNNLPTNISTNFGNWQKNTGHRRKVSADDRCESKSHFPYRRLGCAQGDRDALWRDACPLLRRVVIVDLAGGRLHGKRIARLQPILERIHLAPGHVCHIEQDLVAG